MSDILGDLSGFATKIVDLRTLPGNPRRGDVAAVARSLAAFGQRKPIVARRSDGVVIAGNHTLAAAQSLGWHEIAVVWTDDDDATAKAFALADNRTAELGGYDEADLAALIAEVNDAAPELLDATGWSGADLQDLLNDIGGGGTGDGPRATVNLAERFGVPPFTVLDSRQGYWRARKQAWLALGIRSEEGRGDGATFDGAQRRDPDFYRQKQAVEKKLGRELTTAAFEHDYYEVPPTVRGGGVVFQGIQRRDPQYYTKKTAVEKKLGRQIGAAEFEDLYYEVPAIALTSGTSIFDPVLCELAYRWYSPSSGVVIDPFAGGSVRGVVAAALGRRYYGGELRGEQVEANVSQWAEIGPSLPDVPAPVWVRGDSRTLRANLGGEPRAADLLFTCPPYADLEVYSDDPADLSNMPYDQFLVGYRDCLAEGVALLSDHSFAVVVVGEVRSKRGHGAYYGFVPDTISTMASLGMDYYGEHVLVNMVGSAAMAANKQFTASRKAARVHQTVLVFVKGDAKMAAARCGIDAATDLPDVDVADLIDEG